MAVDFPGTIDYEIAVGNDPSLQITGACTFMAWVIVDAKQNTEIISKQTSGDRGVSLQTDDDGTDTWALFVIALTSSTTKASGWPSSKMTHGEEFHIAGQFVPSTAVQVWQNGVLGNENTTDVPASMHDSANNLVIGGRPEPIGNFNGKVEDTRIYNRNLSAAEMQTIYAARGHDGIVDGLVSRWLLDEKGSGVISGSNSVIDIGGSGNHGSPVGSPTYIDSRLSFKKRAA